MEKKDSFFKNFKNSKYLEMLPSFKEEKTKSFITIALTLLAASIFGLFAINPTLSTITQLQKELEDDRFIDKKLEQKIASLSNLQQKYNLLENDIPIVLAALPQNPKSPLLIGQIQALAQTSNTKITKINVSEVELSKIQGGNKYPSFVFSVEIQGSYQQLTQFLNLLSSFERIVTIDTLSLSKSTEKNNLLQLGVRGKAYFKG